MIIHLKAPGGVTFSLDVEAKALISEVKQLAAEQSKVIAPQQRLFHKGKILQDEDTLESIDAGSTLFMVRGAEKEKEGSSSDAAAAKEEEAKDAVPVLCGGNCGFFGNPKTNNLCSKCFGIQQKKDQEELRKKTERIKEPKKEKEVEAENKTEGEKGAATAEGSDATGKDAEVTPPPEPPVERPVQEKKNKCWQCNKRIGLAGFDCRCGYIFCGTCRHAEQHNCDFDFKTAGQELLRKQNLKVEGEKLDKV